jgi:hypothetical protein
VALETFQFDTTDSNDRQLLTNMQLKHVRVESKAVVKHSVQIRGIANISTGHIRVETAATA